MDIHKHNLENYIYLDQIEHVGDIVRAARRQRGLSQARLADICGLSPKMISLVECGRRGISWRALQRILAGLRFSLTVHPVETNPSCRISELILHDVIPKLKELVEMLEKIATMRDEPIVKKSGFMKCVKE